MTKEVTLDSSEISDTDENGIKDMTKKNDIKNEDSLRKECLERIRNRNERTLFLSFPQPIGSIESVKKLVSKASIVKYPGKSDSYLKNVLVEFVSKKRTHKNLEFLQNKEFSFGKIAVEVLSEEPSINNALHKKRLVVSGLPKNCSEEEIRNLFPTAASFKQNNKLEFEIVASYNFTSEEIATEAFEKGKNLKFKKSKLLVIFDSLKATESPDNLKELCVNRINEHNLRTLYFGFPERFESVAEVRKLIPSASVIKTSNRQLREKNISYAFVEFNSSKEALKVDKMFSTDPELNKYKVDSMKKLTEIDYSVDPLRLIVKNISPEVSNEQLKNIFKSVEFHFKSFDRNNSSSGKRGANFNTIAFLSYNKESEALSDFKKGDCIKTSEEAQPLLILFAPQKEQHKAKKYNPGKRSREKLDALEKSGVLVKKQKVSCKEVETDGEE